MNINSLFPVVQSMHSTKVVRGVVCEVAKKTFLHTVENEPLANVLI